MPATAERKLAMPDTWNAVRISEIELKTYDDYHVSEQARPLYVSGTPAKWEDNTPVLMRYDKVAKFMFDYNKSNVRDDGNALKFITLRDDNEVRKQLDKVANQDSVWINYLTMPGALRPVDGINQQLVHRVLYLYGTDGELHEICPVTIAPSGMVPLLGRDKLEKKIYAKGLKRLEQLRGREIYERDEQIVDVTDAFGNPQFTFGHNTIDEYGLIPHSHHVYTPSQDEPERVGVRDTYWHRDDRRCFRVALDAYADGSRSLRSLPLVRGGNLETNITRHIVRRGVQLFCL